MTAPGGPAYDWRASTAGGQADHEPPAVQQRSAATAPASPAANDQYRRSDLVTGARRPRRVEFGTKRPQVEILSPRPRLPRSQRLTRSTVDARRVGWENFGRIGRRSCSAGIRRWSLYVTIDPSRLVSRRRRRCCVCARPAANLRGLPVCALTRRPAGDGIMLDPRSWLAEPVGTEVAVMSSGGVGCSSGSRWSYVSGHRSGGSA